MEKYSYSEFRRHLLAALFLGLSSLLYSLEPAENTIPQNSEAALNRLTEISNQLSALNTRLRSELSNSRQNSRELQFMLEASKQELDALRQELTILQITSAQLSDRAENSQRELTELLTALKKAESSLLSLELSFEAYRQTAEQRIQGLEKENMYWKIGFIAAGVLAAGFGAAFLAGK